MEYWSPFLSLLRENPVEISDPSITMEEYHSSIVTCLLIINMLEIPC